MVKRTSYYVPCSVIWIVYTSVKSPADSPSVTTHAIQLLDSFDAAFIRFTSLPKNLHGIKQQMKFRMLDSYVWWSR